MQTKKILGIALAAALVGSMATVAVSARDAMDAGEEATYFDSHTIGIVGSMTSWGEQPDIAMKDVNGNGTYIGVVRNLAAGDYDFKVRANSSWDDSWGEYEPDYERTFNSQTNCHVTVAEDGTDLIVALDTTGEDGNVWPVTYMTTSTATATNYGVVGSMTGWGEQPDGTMYDLGSKLMTAVGGKVELPEAGDYEFKVRADSKWDKSWGAYEADYDRTENSQTNCKITVDGPASLFVMMAETGEDDVLWPVSYIAYDDSGVIAAVNTGKPVEDETSDSETSDTETSDTETSDTETSDTETSDTETTVPKTLDRVDFKKLTVIGNFGENGAASETEMIEADENVYAAVFEKLPAGTYNFTIKADNSSELVWGAYSNETETTYKSGKDVAVQLKGNENYLVVVFSTIDDNAAVWAPGYYYISDDGNIGIVNAGPKAEDGMQNFEGSAEDLMKMLLGDITILPTDDKNDNQKQDNTKADDNNKGNSNTDNNNNNNNTNNNNTITPNTSNGKGDSGVITATGDTTTPVAVALTAAAAIGIALIAFKKKSVEE